MIKYDTGILPLSTTAVTFGIFYYIAQMRLR